MVRTYFDANFSWTSGTYAATGAGGTVYSAAAQAGGFGGVGNPSDGGLSGGSFALNFAFIQFAGSQSGGPYPSLTHHSPAIPPTSLTRSSAVTPTQTGVNQFSYTADFGQGVSGTISLQDQVTYYQTNLWNASNLTAANFEAGG